MNTFLNGVLTIVAFLFLCVFCNAQTSKVKLIEKENGKRLELYAKNTDTVPYVVFLRITTEDYRRRSKRPVLKTVAANSETHLTTLIKLVNSKGHYNKQFIVNEVNSDLEFRKDHDGLQVNFDKALNTKTITIYKVKVCNFCETVETLLKKYKIAYHVKDAVKDKEALTKILKTSNLNIDKVHDETMILVVNNVAYTGISSAKEFIEIMNSI